MSSDLSALFAKKKKGKKKKFTSMNANTIEAQEQEEHVDAPPVSKAETAPKDDDGWQDHTEEDKTKNIVRVNRKEVGELLDLNSLQNDDSGDVFEKLNRIEAKQAIHEAVSRQKQQEEVKKDETTEAQNVVKPWSSRRKENDLSDARQFPSLSDALQNKQQTPPGGSGSGGGGGAGAAQSGKLEPKQRPKIAVGSISNWLTSDEPGKPKDESTATDDTNGPLPAAATANAAPPAPPADGTATESPRAAKTAAATDADAELKKAEEEVKASVTKEDLVAKFGKKKKKKKKAPAVADAEA